MTSRSVNRSIFALALQLTLTTHLYCQAPVTAKNIGQVQYADQYYVESGNDIGAAIASAINALPNHCGTVEIASGSYNINTVIVKPRCVLLKGQGAGATKLVFTSGSGPAVKLGDNLGTSLYIHGGIRDLSIETGSPSSPTSATTGIFMGGGGYSQDVSIAAEGQDLSGIRITGFGTALWLGCNVYWESFTIFKS